jgi:Fe-S-cluster-containing hydrogenase component 2
MREQIARVDTDLCTGCGACVEVCPADAIALVDGRAHVDKARCTGCGACVGACPEEAILRERESALEGELVAVESRSIPTTSPSGGMQPARPVSRIVTLLAPALAFVGREILPRLAVHLLDAWDRRTSRAAPSRGDSTSVQPARRSSSGVPGGTGQQRQHRRRGGR